MRTLNALIASILIFGMSSAHAAGGQNAYIQRLGEIRSSLGSSASAGAGQGGQGFRFVPADYREPVENPFLEKLNKARRSIYRTALPAILSVRAGGSQGSGFIVDPKGIVYTNYHVVTANKVVAVEFFDGKSYPAKVLAAAPGRDIAILQIEDDFKDWPALRIGDASVLDEGDIVFALGNPVGLGISLSQGTVSRKNQATVNYWVDFLQSDIQISAGNSGGPLLDHTGRVVGMNTAITGTSGKIGLAVKTSDLLAAYKEYKADGKIVDGYVDLGIIEVQAPGMTPAVVVHHVTPGSSAEQAGLKTGDAILSYDGAKVKAGVGHQVNFFRSFGLKRPGDQVALEVMRGEKVMLRFPGAETGVDAYLSGTEGVILLGEGNRHFLLPIMQMGMQPEAVLEKNGESVAVEIIIMAQDGSFAAFRIADEAKRRPAAGATQSMRVTVEEYSTDSIAKEAAKEEAGEAPAAPEAAPQEGEKARTLGI